LLARRSATRTTSSRVQSKRFATLVVNRNRQLASGDSKSRRAAADESRCPKTQDVLPGKTGDRSTSSRNRPAVASAAPPPVIPGVVLVEVDVQ
jgi:hypothetical protein